MRTRMGLIANIQRFSLHDGPGIRTTVFLKGCLLNCLWCQNPETLSGRPELMFTRRLCALCRLCERVCERQAHEFEDGVHRVRYELCAQCGKCVAACPAEALGIVGAEMSVGDVVDVVRKDRDFYERSGGGVTVSGGEALMQPDFALALLAACAREAIHTALDTSGYAPPEVFASFLDVVNLFLFDIKAIDEERHKRLAGADNAWILQNLKSIIGRGAPVIVRVPLVPGFNDDAEELRRMAEVVAALSPKPTVQLLPHHDYGRHKYEALGMSYRMPEETRRPAPESVEAAKAIFAQHGLTVIEEV
ncbi:MAG: glycyl-radical enzyme activating protein [Candidatus Sumerlaeota bacterium]|nr:glycyl-radical enzyme activating protein [Candidatus Sumerlaeota bacterium]